MNSIGHFFRVTTFGESHSGGVGCVIDGCPPGHKIDLSVVQDALNRRKPGQSELTSPRAEADEVRCLSGLTDGVALGSPICLLVHNQDFKPKDYKDLEGVLRPSHADFSTQEKYGVRAKSGGGRSSARETIGRVAAAAVANQVLKNLAPDLKILAYVQSVKDVCLPDGFESKFSSLNQQLVDQSATRCPDPNTAKKMEALILKAKEQGDTVGGVIFCGICGCPPGLGEPVFSKLEAEFAKAMMSLPASKGFEIGSGFQAPSMFGSEHNDEFYMEGSRVRTRTNHSGGVQGGISNGEDITMRIAFKPVSTIFKKQKSVSSQNKEITYAPSAGRHDPCVLPRAVPMVEAMASLVICDFLLRQRALIASRSN